MLAARGRRPAPGSSHITQSCSRDSLPLTHLLLPKLEQRRRAGRDVGCAQRLQLRQGQGAGHGAARGTAVRQYGSGAGRGVQWFGANGPWTRCVLEHLVCPSPQRVFTREPPVPLPLGTGVPVTCWLAHAVLYANSPSPLLPPGAPGAAAHHGPHRAADRQRRVRPDGHPGGR